MVIDIQPLSSPMSGSPYKQLHEIKCGPVNTSDRLNLVDVSNNGYIATVADKAILLYNVERYLKANSDCSLRKDKPLPDHSSDVRISVTDPVFWLAFNSEGLVLAVATSDTSKGTLVHLLDLKEALKHSACNLSDVSRPIRVCGGEGLTTDGHPGWEIRDFAWNPTIPALFVTILRSGAVRLLSATPNATEPDELVDQLPSTADARCLSWSTKGKQLAICITGTVTTQTGPMCGPLILQTDPKLRLKRIVPLNTLKDQIGAGSVFCPLDILWTSPSCFIIGLQSSSKTTNNTMNALMVNAPTKSTEVTFSEIPDLRLHSESIHCQYYWRAIGSGHFIATPSEGGEQLHVFQISSGSTSPLISVAQIELPPSGFVLGLAMGFYWPYSPSGDRSKVVAYLITRLTNGNLAPYALRMREVISPIIAALPEPVELPVPPVPSDAPVSLSSAEPQSQSPFQTANTTGPVSTSQNPNLIFNNRLEATPNSTFAGLSRDTSTPIVQPQASPKTDPVLDKHMNITLQQSFPLPSSTTVVTEQQNPRVLQAVSSVRPVAAQASVLSTPRDVPLPKSLQIAAAQFSAALQAEAESGRAAWCDLFEMMLKGHQTAIVNTEKPTRLEPSGVDVTESKLHDTELFLKALDDVLCELNSSCLDRKEEVSNCAAYADKVRKALRVCAAGDWIPVLAGHLDPESARLLGRLKQKSRLVESVLFDLDSQLESLSTEINQRLSSSIRVSLRSGVDRKTETGMSTPTSKLLSVLDTTTRLLQTERGRVDYIRERFERLQAVSGTPMKELSWSVENSFSTPRTSRPHASRTKSMAEATGDHWINPAWYSLAQRDRALYRLFAKHQLPTVHAQFVAPLISDTSESTAACVAAVISSTDSEALASNQTEQMESLRPAMGEISLNNPQQMKLDKLVDMSGKAANANSPPSTKSLLIQDPSRTSTSFGQSARATPSSPFIVKAAPVRITTSSTVHAISETTKPALVSSTAVTATTTGANVTDSPSPMQKTEPSAGATSCSMTDAHASFSPTGSFRLGLKAAACMSPVPTNVVVQKSSVVSPDALSSPVRTCTPTSVSSGTTTVSQSVNPQSHLYSQETRSPGLVPASPPGQSVSAAHPTSTFTSPATTLSLSPSADGASIFAQPKTSPVVTVLGTVISKTEALSTTAVTPSGVTTPLSTASPFAFLSTSSVAAANLFGSTGTSLFGPAVTTAVASSAALPPGQTKPADMGSQSVTSATGVTTASSIFSLPLFGTASKIQAEVTAATSTGPTVSTGGLFQLGSSTLPATSTVATTATAMASMRSLFGAQPSTPAFGTPAFGSTVVTTAAATTISSTMTNSVSLFGAPSMANSSSGGLFGSLKTNTSTVASAVPSGFLFGSLTTAASGGGLFGTVMVKTTTPVSQPTTVTGLFGSSQTTTAGSVGSGSLFGAMDAATTSAASATGPPANAIVSTTAASTGLFGGSFSATGAPSAGLFGAVATTSAPATAGLFGLSTATSNAPSIGLFGAKSIPATTTTQPSATSPNTQQAGGLFGALGHAPQQNTGSNTGTKEIGNLFSGSSFGLGSAAISPQTPPQNVFGRPSAVPSASPGLFGAPSKPAGAGLFGAPAFGANITSPNTGTGLFGSSSPASAGLFGSVGTGERGGLFGTSTATTTASTGLFGSSATAVSSPSNTGGLFGSSGATAPPAGGGLFGSSASGGFGSRPVFDSSGFGSAAAQSSFGIGGAVAFGSTGGSLLGANPLSLPANTGASLFGSSLAASAPVAEGLFSGLAAKSGGPSFGSLAMGSPSAPAAPASPFGSSPSFTQRRA